MKNTAHFFKTKKILKKFYLFREQNSKIGV
jgi:hypothetical protein